ncbi:MAG: bifunctional 5,10-methylenetetrahydrofolate dehydrogenase/5,10-methenyltetrahydrofolate cyclohydrolase [Anaerovoracaceae bacterium]|jgi:methylenetetrahydrofolate dehydrogenase (NADP+)/methenyltetrahydrofolate cyclohydrolase
MTKSLGGREVAEKINKENRERAARLREQGTLPCLAIIRVGERADDIAYERRAVRSAEATGIEVTLRQLADDAAQEELISLIRGINADDSIHGVLLLRPLPRRMDEETVRNSLDPRKDVDGITDISLAGVFCGALKAGYPPCTAEACMRILDHYDIDIEGKNAVVVGRSQVVGKPLAMMLLDRNATVTVCHTRTGDLASFAREADILVAAAGRAGAVGAECLSPGQVVIDVGINVIDGKLCGDVDAEAAEGTVAARTPVPGGVGAVTVSVLLSHLLQTAEGK